MLTRTHLLAVLALVTVPSGCDLDGALDRVRSELHFTPREQDITAWVGITHELHLQIDNRGAAVLHPNVSALTLVGAPAGVTALSFDASIARLGAGQSSQATLTVTTAPEHADTNFVLELTLPVSERNIAPARARVVVNVRVPPPCVAADPCEVATFIPETGACERVALPETTPCDDGSLCTESDRCSAGRCIGVQRPCDDRVECTADSCNAQSGCVFEPVPSRCADGNPCTDDVCDRSDGCSNPTSPEGTLCGDVNCSGLSLCALGVCTSLPTPDGFPCEDGDLCTVGDRCESQQCVPGDDAAAQATPPVVLPRPTAYLAQQANWFVHERVPWPEAAPTEVEVELHVGEVLDLDQRLAHANTLAATPVLAVLWKSTPFDVRGQPCDPFFPLAAYAFAEEGDVPTFCATALVMTLIDEAELRAASRGTTVGTSQVLHVAYGTVDASIAPQTVYAVPDSQLVVESVVSTYFPFPDSAREIHLYRFEVDVTFGAPLLWSGQHYFNLPNSSVATNIHQGVRIAAGQDAGNSGLLGWDRTRTDGIDDLPGTDGQAQEPPPPPEAPQAEFGLDLIASLPPVAPGEYGDANWSNVVNTTCVVDNRAAVLPDLEYRDVDVVRANDASLWGVYRRAIPSDATCNLEAPHTQGMLVNLTTGTTEWPSGINDVLSISLSPYADLMATSAWAACPAEEGSDCPPFSITIDTSPLDHSNPFPSYHTAGIGNFDTSTVEVEALDQRGGVVGAVALTRTFGDVATLQVLDELNTDAPVTQTSDWILPTNPQAPVARRSPLHPTAVYAAMAGSLQPTADTDGPIRPATQDAVVVRFGCPFPSLP